MDANTATVAALGLAVVALLGKMALDKRRYLRNGNGNGRSQSRSAILSMGDIETAIHRALDHRFMAMAQELVNVHEEMTRVRDSNHALQGAIQELTLKITIIVDRERRGR